MTETKKYIVTEENKDSAVYQNSYLKLVSCLFVFRVSLLCQYLFKCFFVFLFFFSLNEYVNAGIEAVKITEENASSPHHVTSLVATPKEAFVTPNSGFVATTKHETIGNYSNSGDTTVSNSRKFSADLQTADSTELMPTDDVRSSPLTKSNFSTVPITSLKQSEPSNQEQLKSDQEPFVSQQFYQISVIQPEQSQPNQDSSKIIQDSSKIVTASTEFCKFNPDSIETESSIHDDDDEDEDDDVEEEEDELSESEDSESDAGDEKTTDPEIGERTVDSVEFRTELSSVVPPTSISLEITASHETDTALPDIINGESSEILAKESNNQVENQNDHRANELMNNEIVAECQQIQNNSDRFIKPLPITFETAATMDDVSDTELESYLQELEDLEENPIAATVKPKCDSVKSAIDSMKSEDVEPYVNNSIYNVDNSIENVGELSQIASKDDRNADSFSQASTVEFGEVNATSSNEQLPNVNSDQLESVQHIESVQSIDSVLDVEPTAEISEQQVDNQVVASVPSQITSELENGEAERELSSDAEHHTECSECGLDQQASGGAAATAAAAKRPNSLNLQNCNTTLIDQQQQQQQQQNPSNSALNFSSDENAGNTPAACGQFLSSSISSDDSNIANDNNQMIVSGAIVFCKTFVFKKKIFASIWQ